MTNSEQAIGAPQCSAAPSVHPGPFCASVALLSICKAAALQPLLFLLTHRRVGRRFPFAAGAWQSGGGGKHALRGLPILCVGSALSDGVYLSQYQFGSLYLLPDDLKWGKLMHATESAESTMWSAFASGFFSEFTRQCLLTPFCVVGTLQMLATTTEPLGAWAAATRLFYGGGCRSLFAGLGASLMFGPLWTASWWAAYEYLKQQAHLSPSIASVVASASTAIAFTPFLVIRTRLQASAGVAGGFHRIRSVMASISNDAAAKKVLMFGQVGRVASVMFVGWSWTVLHTVLDGLAASSVYETALVLSSE